MVRQAIVSAHLSSLFQSGASFRVLVLGLALGFRVSFRVGSLALHYFLPHYFRSIHLNGVNM